MTSLPIKPGQSGQRLSARHAEEILEAFLELRAHDDRAADEMACTFRVAFAVLDRAAVWGSAPLTGRLSTHVLCLAEGIAERRYEPARVL